MKKEMFLMVMIVMIVSVVSETVNAQKVKVWDDCESLGEKPNNWHSHESVIVLSDDKRQGQKSVSATGVTVERLRRIYPQPFDAGVTKETGFIAFSLNIERPELLKGSGYITLSSAGRASKDATTCPILELKVAKQQLVAGWNDIILPLSAFRNENNGQTNLSALDYFRILLNNKDGDTTPQTIKIDNIRFGTSEAELKSPN